MAVLVTGGAGFIGSHVGDRLLAQEQTVVCVDDFNDFYDPALKWQNIRQAQTSPRFHLHQVSITDTPAMADVFAQHSTRLLDWQPVTPFGDGIRPFVDWFELTRCIPRSP
jgi:nucleoside-diphosphate-sugar epimerase